MVHKTDAVVSSKPVCKLAPGELRRVPTDRSRSLIGYHVACPACGFVNIALPDAEGLRVDEATTTFSERIGCLRCHAHLRIDHGAFFWEEGQRVRRRSV